MSGVFGTNGHPNPSLAHGGSDAKRFQRASYDANTLTENQLATMHQMERKCLRRWD